MIGVKIWNRNPSIPCACYQGMAKQKKESLGIHSPRHELAFCERAAEKHALPCNITTPLRAMHLHASCSLFTVTHRNEDGLAASVHSQVPRIDGWASKCDERGHCSIVDLADGVVAAADKRVMVFKN